MLPEKAWHKSSYSDKLDTCVEVALTSQAVGVRDTKDRAAGHFEVSAGSWQAFVSQLKSGRYDQ